MNYKSLFFSILVFFVCPITIQAQSIEGRWEGTMGDEILQLTIVKDKGTICGYSYDYKIADRKDHCKAYFSGAFSEAINAWILNGTSFIENSGTHVLMQMRLREVNYLGSRILSGIVLPQSGSGISALSNYLEVTLQKVPVLTSELNALLSTCFPAAVKNNDKEEKRQKDNDKNGSKRAEDTTNISANIDDVKYAVDSLIPATEDQSEKEMVDKMANRKKTEIRRLVIDTQTIHIKVFDNGVVDNDTVSIFYNNKLLVNKQRLSDKAIEFDITLDEGISDHELVMYAENLGGIPPNTALVIVTAGKNRYELFSSASLEENAVLRFEYKPQ